MKKDEILYGNPWLSLKRLAYPEKDIYGYIYSHESRCNGEIVAILPWRINNNNLNKLEFMLRNEVTPCWHEEDPQISSITGGVEDGNIGKTIEMELLEEAGYVANRDEFLKLGTCRGSKSSDTIYHLFAINCTKRTRQAASGDGSKLEEKAECFWASSIGKAVDPLVYVLHHRFNSLPT